MSAIATLSFRFLPRQIPERIFSNYLYPWCHEHLLGHCSDQFFGDSSDPRVQLQVLCPVERSTDRIGQQALADLSACLLDVGGDVEACNV